jgi:hypothetical protein
MAQQFKDMKVRLDPDKADKIKLWLDSGTARVSFTAAMGLLMDALHDQMYGDCTLEVLAISIQQAAKEGQNRIEQKRAGR